MIKFNISFFISIITLGLFSLILWLLPKIKVWLYYESVDIKQARYIFVIDDDNNYSIIEINKIRLFNEKETDFTLTSRTEMMNSNYIDEDILENKTDTLISIVYRFNKYLYIEDKDYLISLK
jgi:hypothetical protein